MPIRTARTTTMAAVAALALFPVLAGCSAGGQSVADACDILTNGTEELNAQGAELQNAALSGDADAIDELIASVDEEISSLGEDITNDEVKPVYEKFAGAFSDLTTQLQDMASIDTSDVDALTEATEAMTATTTELTDASTELTEVCGA